MSAAAAAIPTAATPTAPAGLPGWLDLTLVSRRPARLPEATRAAALALPVPATVPVAAADAAPAASIVVVTYNNLAFTKLCLASVLANTDGPGYEVIVVDNGSSDGTPDYLRAVAAAHRHVRTILNDANRGFAAANNQGLAVVRGDVLVLLNNDTIVPPGWLAALARHLDDPSVGLAGPVTNRIGNEAEVRVEYNTYADFLRAAADRVAGRAGRWFDIPRPAMFCLALRRDTRARIGPLDERFEVGLFEDDDYAMRARAAGYRLACAEDVLVHHFGEASFGGLFGSGEHGRVFEANRRRFEAKWGTTWEPPGRRADPRYDEDVARIREVVRRAIPAGERVLVAAKGDDRVLGCVGPGARHFPQGPDGGYAGHHPPDGATAIEHLEALRAGGAGFLLFPRQSLWWLDHYAALRHHLEARYVRLVDDPAGACLIYDLCGTGAPCGPRTGPEPGAGDPSPAP